jgi:hypothetical protein
MGRDQDAELKRESEIHLDLEAEEPVAAGASEEELGPAEAEAAIARELRNLLTA